MKQQALALMMLLGWLATWPAAAQEEDHAHHQHAEAEALGKVHFPVVCMPELQPAFDRAVAPATASGWPGRSPSAVHPGTRPEK